MIITPNYNFDNIKFTVPDSKDPDDNTVYTLNGDATLGYKASWTESKKKYLTHATGSYSQKEVYNYITTKKWIITNKINLLCNKYIGKTLIMNNATYIIHDINPVDRNIILYKQFPHTDPFHYKVTIIINSMLTTKIRIV